MMFKQHLPALQKSLVIIFVTPSRYIDILWITNAYGLAVILLISFILLECHVTLKRPVQSL
jgi:hypothetical protein